MWSILANRQLAGVRFNRQVPIGPFICDFVARSAKLVIEIDRGQHGEAIGYDARRTAFLEARGYTVLRFWNNEVMQNLDGVATTIAHALSPPAGAGGVDSPQASGGGTVISEDDRPSPSPLCGSSPPALAGGGGKSA